jgi:hypothetical protein
MTPSGIYQVVHDRARAAGLPAMHPRRPASREMALWLALLGRVAKSTS